MPLRVSLPKEFPKRPPKSVQKDYVQSNVSRETGRGGLGRGGAEEIERTDLNKDEPLERTTS